jgi:DNA (cytosine-5)-methyltransferase 1
VPTLVPGLLQGGFNLIGTGGGPTPFRFIDLFAGIGGLRLGLEAAGGTCVFSVEIDRFARQTYEANFDVCDGQDIRTVQGDELPEYDVLAAGFPCQPFSIAGVSKKLSLGRKHGFAEEKSGNLFFEIARLIEDGPAPPPVVFLENVKNLVGHDQGRTFRVIRDTLENLGYNVTHQVIDGQRWVPQHRERTYVVGLHHETFGAERFSFPDLPEISGRTLEEVLQQDVDPKYVLTEPLWQYLQEYARKHKAAGNGFGFGLARTDGVTRTLSARYYKDGSEILVPTHSGPPRRLTPRECARLMGFPDTFVIPVSDMQAYRQFGNSVVVPAIAFLGIYLADRYVSRAATVAA